MKKQNLTVVGAGSTYTLGMMNSLIAEKETFPLKRVVFYDIDAKRQESNAKATEILFREHYPEVEEFIYTTDKEVAFSNSDFFFIQIRTGGLEARERDEQIPLTHGCVGQETCGAGGMAYGLRSIGDMITLINEIRTYSKDAWILNYTNPAAIVAEALNREFADDKRLTINYGAGYQVLLNDVFAWHVSARQHVYEIDLLGDEKNAINTELSTGVSIFF